LELCWWLLWPHALEPAPHCKNYGSCAANQIGGQHWQPIKLTIRRAIYDGQVAAFEIATFIQAFPDCLDLIKAEVYSGQQANH
jgi:hypothetical protein